MRRGDPGNASGEAGRNGQPYNRGMTLPASAPDPGLVALARRAAELESRGAWTEAVAAWSSAVESHPSFLPARLGLAQALIRAGKPADALPVLGQISAAAPNVPAVWLALAVAQSMLGRHDLAVDNAKRAVALAPNVAAVHAGLGDVLRQAGRLADAADAYRKAVAKAPDDPDALNKLAVIERACDRPGEAESLLRRACTRAPQHPYVRVNLGTLELELGREAEGRSRLEAALAGGTLPQDARDEASDAIAMLDERSALAPAIEAALAAGDPAPLAHALRARPAPPRRDEDLIAFFERAASSVGSEPPVDARFAHGAPAFAAWPALEAHHNFRLPGTTEAIARSVALFQRRIAPVSDDDRDVARYAAVVAQRDPASAGGHDPVASEAWLRLLHAQLVGHRPELAPGQFKLINNLVRHQPQVARTPAGAVAGTLRTWFGGLAATVPEGPWRAAFLMLVLSEVHPFRDGNGRVQRYLVNAELARAGIFPHLRPGNRDDALSSLLNEARASGALRPLVEWLAAGTRYAEALDRDWASR